MLNPQEHLDKVEHNLSILRQTNKTVGNSTDWQVTYCFYTALHIISAYLAKKGTAYYNHKDTFDAINPENSLNINAIPINIYNDYAYLSNQSRLARYMINAPGTVPLRFKDKHLERAIIALDNIMKHFSATEAFVFKTSTIATPILPKTLAFFSN